MAKAPGQVFTYPSMVTGFGDVIYNVNTESMVKIPLNTTQPRKEYSSFTSTSKAFVNSNGRTGFTSGPPLNSVPGTTGNGFQWQSDVPLQLDTRSKSTISDLRNFRGNLNAPGFAGAPR